jgi:uncharacterized protein
VRLQLDRLAGLLLMIEVGCGAPAPGARSSSDAAPSPPVDAAVPVTPSPDAARTDDAPAMKDAAPMTSPDAATDAARADAAAAGGTVLVYSHTTGNRHDHIPRAVASLQAALRERGFTVEASEDPAWFTTARLSPLAGIILVSTTGTPLGDPGLEALAALEAYVRGGGVLVGLHAASSTFYDPALPYTPLIGGKFEDHPGGVRMDNCHAQGDHPAVAHLPEPFVVRDEIYSMSHLRADNEVILTCDALGGGRLPIAWHRQEGRGRLFYTALGHEVADWALTAPYFRDHALPGILWALGR